MGCLGCDWDPRKSIENWRKHGISFEDACCVFEDPWWIEELDDREYDEERRIVLGKVRDVVLVVVYTNRDGGERIISARRALQREVVKYFVRELQQQ